MRIQFKHIQKVTFYNGYTLERGVIKSVDTECTSHIFIVYKCNRDWAHFYNYTGVRTFLKYLILGWVDDVTEYKKEYKKLYKRNCAYK